MAVWADAAEDAGERPIDPGTWLALLTEQAHPSAGHIRVLGRFAAHADQDGIAAPSLSGLARDLGVRLETVRHAVVGTALRGGWLVKVREADPSHSEPTTYRLTIPQALEQAA